MSKQLFCESVWNRILYAKYKYIFLPPPDPTFERFELMKPQAHLSGSGAGSGAATNQGSLKKVERVRSVFPETWLWSSYSSGYISRSNYHLLFLLIDML